MTIREAAVAVLLDRFGCSAFHSGDAAEEIAIFPAAHPDVGDVVVSDDGDEITVTVGSISHGHFNAFDLSPDQAAQRIAEDVADFIESLFAGRVLLWKNRQGSSGGWDTVAEGETPTRRANVFNYLWTGPIAAQRD